MPQAEVGQSVINPHVQPNKKESFRKQPTPKIIPQLSVSILPKKNKKINRKLKSLQGKQ